MTRIALPLARLLVAGLATFLVPAVAQPVPEDVVPRMRAAAQALLAGTDERRREKLVLGFEDAARTEWHYTPRSRPGLTFADLEPGQREAVHALLRTALSAVGHRKVVDIIELERVLRETEFALSLLRDPQKYAIVFFGAPDAARPWGWRFEGHHVSLNFTLRGDSGVATTPSFLGANPAEVRQGAKRGLRVLAAEEDEARRLLDLLDPAQRRAAIVDARPYGDILTANKDRAVPLDGRGLVAGAMTAPQKAQLRRLLEVYADAFEPGLRRARLERVAQDFDEIRFAWAGGTERGKPHYYRLQGPRFLVEYDASQNDGNHVHTVWRDFEGDFGRDLLREHRERHRH